MTLPLYPPGDGPPCNIEAERLTLGSCIVYPQLLRDLPITAADFFGEKHRVVWRELQYLAAEGEPIDTLHLRVRLETVGKLAFVGDDYLLDLTDGIVTKDPPVDVLQRCTKQRVLRALGQRLTAAGAAGDDAAAEAAVRAASAALEARSKRAPVEWQWLHEAIPTLLKPVGQRLDTGFATLDEATRGGIPLARVVMLLGAPGAAKTTLAAYLADRWERAGATVAILAADEPPEGIAVRLGQLAGWSRDALEGDGEASESVRSGFAKRAEGRKLMVLDPDEHGWSIEDAAQALHEAARGAPRVLVVDSLQTARCGAAAGAETAMERIDASISALKRVARSGTLVLAISEMSRAGYRGDAGQVSALSAGKGSGSIEYGGSLVLGLRSVKDEPGQVDVEVAKNRIRGGKPEFRLQQDFERASFTEIIKDSAVPASSRTQLDKHIEMVVQAVLKARKPLETKTQLALAVDLRRQAAFDAVGMALHEGRIAIVDGRYAIVNRSKEGV